MEGCADIIVIVRSEGSRGGSDMFGWLELQSLYLDRRGAWTVEASCGCVATQASWRRCHEHDRLKLLFIQTRLPFQIAES